MGLVTTIKDWIMPTPHKVEVYCDIFDPDTGKWIAGLPMEKRKKEADLLTEAAEKYSGKTAIITVMEDHRKYYHGYTRDMQTGQPVPPPEPTVEEVQAQALEALDAEYAAKVSAKKNEITEAVNVYQDDALATLRRKELEDIKVEYIQKRGEL